MWGRCGQVFVSFVPSVKMVFGTSFFPVPALRVDVVRSRNGPRRALRYESITLLLIMAVFLFIAMWSWAAL